MKKVINFGILGCGGIADFHADAIGTIENAELIGAADNMIEYATKFAEKRNIKAYQSYEEMLADENIDAVCICTPSGFHAENAIAALNAKKHVVLEKPMAISSEDGKRIIEVCQKSGCVLTIISQIRFSEDIRRVKELVSENAFGKIVFADLYMKYWRSPEYYSSSNWKGTKKFDGGGALMNQGIHGIDILLYIMGDAKVIASRTKTAHHNIEVEDLAIAMLEFESGAVGTIEGSTCAYPGFEKKIEIMGTEGCAILVENKLDKLIVKGETLIENGAAGALNTASDPLAMSSELHALQIQNFVNTIYGEESIFVDCYDGLKAVNLIEEIYKN